MVLQTGLRRIDGAALSQMSCGSSIPTSPQASNLNKKFHMARDEILAPQFSGRVNPPRRGRCFDGAKRRWSDRRSTPQGRAQRVKTHGSAPPVEAQVLRFVRSAARFAGTRTAHPSLRSGLRHLRAGALRSIGSRRITRVSFVATTWKTPHSMTSPASLASPRSASAKSARRQKRNCARTSWFWRSGNLS